MSKRFIKFIGYRAPAQYIKHNKNMTNSQKGTTIMKRIISILSVMMGSSVRPDACILCRPPQHHKV